MKITYILLAGLIPGAIMELIAIITGFMPSPLFQIIASISMYVITVIGILLFDFIYNGHLRSHLDLWRIGKIRGLWRDKALARQLEKHFYSSTSIKIKVTRGYELLNENKTHGLLKILEALRDDKNKRHNSTVNMQILLVLPCYQEPHVRERYEAHQNMNKEEFLETWYKFVEKIRTFDSDHLSINVRFYLGSHARWRFYIFDNIKPNNHACVLLSEYDQSTHGVDEPMYRIIRGPKNVADFMCKYFNDLWEDSSTFSPRKLYDFIQSQKCQSHFCKNCDANGDSVCMSCGRKKCEFEDICKKFTQHYKEVLMSFNAGGDL